MKSQNNYIITTLNPVFGIFVASLSIVVFLGEISYGNTGVAAFVLGYISTLPLIVMIWRTMKKNWPVYRKFYSMPFHKRDMKTIRKSWRLTWWTLPYSLIVFSALDVVILLNPYLGSLNSFLFGSLFATFGFTALESAPYYKDVKKRRK